MTNGEIFVLKSSIRYMIREIDADREKSNVLERLRAELEAMNRLIEHS
jgi:hypothetical protein